MKRLVGERRAVAAAVLIFYMFVYALLALAMAPPGLERAMFAMAGCYGLAFFGVVAGYFWGRWYAIGIALSGVITTLVGMWQIGAEPVLLFVGATHAAVVLALWGEAMSMPFDGRSEWRLKFHMDEPAVHRLGRAVIRIGISLPYILLYALAPRSAAGDTVVGLGVLAMTTAGLWGMFRMRTWGLVALVGATALLGTGAIEGSSAANGIDLSGCALAGAVLLGAALIPFATPIVSFLRSPLVDRAR